MSSLFSVVGSLVFVSLVLDVLSPVIALYKPHDVRAKHKIIVQLRINNFLFIISPQKNSYYKNITIFLQKLKSFN